MCFRQKMEGSQIDGCHNTQRWLKNCFAWQKNIFFNAHISQLTVRRLACISHNPFRLHVIKSWPLHCKGFFSLSLRNDRNDKRQILKKKDTFIIHMKEITDRFNLEEIVPVYINWQHHSRQRIFNMALRWDKGLHIESVLMLKHDQTVSQVKEIGLAA